MEKVWIYDDEPTDKYELKVSKFLKKALKNDEIADKTARTLGLYKFLSSNKFESSDDIYNAVYLDKAKKEHFFSKSNAKTIFKFLTGQEGGASDMAEARPYDKLIWRWFEFVYWVTPSQIQDVVKFVEPFAFPLHTIETDLPGIGEAIGFSVDLAAETNKVIAKSLQQIPGQFFGLPATILGYLFSTFFICINMAIFVSRKELGQAYTQSFALIPIFGMAIQNALESGDKVLEKYSAKRAKFVEQLKTVFPGLGDFINMVLFDPNYSGDAQADATYWKGKIGEQVSSIKQQLGTKESREAFLAATTQKAKDTLESAKAAANSIAKSPAVEAAKTRALAAATQGTAALRSAVKGNKQAGGKRFSKIGRSKSKWKTQRKLKK
jgi:hypothetical protein